MNRIILFFMYCNEISMSFVTIEDKLQQQYDYSNYTIVRDIVLVLGLYISYAYLNYETFTRILKVYFAFLIFRFVMSHLTTIHHQKDNTIKKYFQISGHMTLFTLIVLHLSNYNVFNLQNLTLRTSTLVLYGLLNVLVHAHYTTDIINTAIIVHFVHGLM